MTDMDPADHRSPLALAEYQLEQALERQRQGREARLLAEQECREAWAELQGARNEFRRAVRLTLRRFNPPRG